MSKKSKKPLVAVHQMTFTPLPGQRVSVLTSYEGVVLRMGQPAGVKLGYRIMLNEKIVIESRKDDELFVPPPQLDIRGPGALLALLEDLTNPIRLAHRIDQALSRGKKGAKQVAELEALLALEGPLWDAITARLGQPAH